MRYLFCASACAALTLSVPAWANPGLGGEVYGATVEKGEAELEVQYDRLGGRTDSGTDVFKLEAAYGVSNRLRVAVLSEFGKEPGQNRRAEEIGIEGTYYLGKAAGIAVALYGEYAVGLHGPDKLESKLLLQHRNGPWDVRFNLTAEKPLQSGAAVELSYAARADVAVNQRLRLGVEAFGDLGTFHKFGPAEDHFVGPTARIRLLRSDPDGDGDDHGGLTLSPSYLFALGATRQSTDGQLRLKLEYEF